MGKRFTETEKWSDPWFRRLSSEKKLAWLYLLDNCDLAGVVDLDHELANFQIGADVDWDGFVMGEGSDRIDILPNGKLFVIRFIEFQHGSLSENCKAHGPAFRSLEKNGVNQRVSKGYPKGIHTLKVKVKVKDKVIAERSERASSAQEPPQKSLSAQEQFELFWLLVPKKVAKKACRKHYDAAIAALAPHQDPHVYLREKMILYAKSRKAASQYAWEPRSWLRDGHYDDDLEVWDEHKMEGPILSEKTRRTNDAAENFLRRSSGNGTQRDDHPLLTDARGELPF